MYIVTEMNALNDGHVLPGGALEVRTHIRKGRSLYTTRLVKGGEIVLDEAPLLLLVAPDTAHSTCIACLRAVRPQERMECSVCHQACFCSASCQQTAQGTPWLHSGPLCSAYARLATLALLPEEQSQMRFLLHVLALRHTGTAEAERRFAALSRLVGEATETERAAAARLVPVMAETLRDLQGAGGSLHITLNVEELAKFLRKEQLNSYGVLAAPHQHQHQHGAYKAPGPGCRDGAGSGQVAANSSFGAGCSDGGGSSGTEGVDGERRLRGSALYAQASLINHECLPNVARFDDFDSGRADSTHVTFRALHDLPPGTELVQSYVPLHWNLVERQAQCREVYGFACTCPRCQTESQWSDDDEGKGEESEWETDSGDGDMEADGEDSEAAAAAGAAGPDGGGEQVDMQEAQPVITALPGEEGPLEPTYLRLFLLKYMCAAPGCFGTAAPAKPGSSLLECNVCGRSRSERDFLRELERSQHEERRRRQQQQQEQQQQQQQQHRSKRRPLTRR